jgi:hypothetical protein
VFLTLVVFVSSGSYILLNPTCHNDGDALQIASSKDPPSIPDMLSWAVKDLALQCLHINSELRPSAKELLHHGCFVNWRM